MIRRPSVAGRFYPSNAFSLTEEVKLHVKHSPESKLPNKKIRALGIVSPHAGFIYSGDVAGAVYSKIEIPNTVILIGPNHKGLGEKISVMTEGTWKMPQGEVQIDNQLANEICQTSLIAKKDNQAHKKEHSLETQLPFLQYYRDDFKIVPICMMQLGLDECKEIALAIVKVVEQLEAKVLIVASSDMTHYETHESALKKDHEAIAQILKLDAKKLYHTVQDNHISMCGVYPTTVMIMCANKMGAKEAVLAKYMTSGETSGDMNHVVGYAGIIVK